MKKFTKVCLITSLALILTGGIICAIGALTGGWRQVDEIGEGQLWWRVANRIAGTYNYNYLPELEDVWDYEYDDWDYGHGDWDYGHGYWGDEYPEDVDRTNWNTIGIHGAGKSITKEYTDTGIGAEDVTQLQIDVGGAALYFLESENNNFGVKRTGKGNYRYDISGGRFYLESGTNRHIVSTGNNEKLYLYIPKGLALDQLSVCVGAGVAELGELSAQEIDMEVGAGMISADRINCQSLDVETGAGRVTLNGIEAGEMSLIVGAGYAYAEGSVSHDLNVECGIGVVELKVQEAFEDFNYNINCAAGSVTLGNRSYSVFADDKYINNKAPAECSLDCAMGSVSMKFDN